MNDYSIFRASSNWCCHRRQGGKEAINKRRFGVKKLEAFKSLGEWIPKHGGARLRARPQPDLLDPTFQILSIT